MKSLNKIAEDDLVPLTDELVDMLGIMAPNSLRYFWAMLAGQEDIPDTPVLIVEFGILDSDRDKDPDAGYARIALTFDGATDLIFALNTALHDNALHDNISTTDETGNEA